MAARSLDEEVKRKRAAAALLNGDGTDDTDPDPDPDPDDEVDPDDSSEQTQEPQAEKTIYAPPTKKGPSYVLVPLDQTGKAAAAPDTSGHIDLGPPKTTDTSSSAAPATPQSFFQPMPQSGDAPTVIAPSNVQMDEETGTRYVVDPDSGQKVPYAEPATDADKAAFKPGDVTLPSRTVEAPTSAPATRYNKNLQWTDPDPDNPDYKTPLSPQDELAFQAWVKKNKVPFDDSPQSDYDMRGFWKAAQEGDPDASTAVSKFDGRIHFNDKFKTPFHKTFSNESQYATSDAPHWVGDRLIDNAGNVVADETPGQKPAPAVQRGQLVSVPPGTAPKAVGVAAPVPAPPAVRRADLVDPDPDSLYVDDQGNYIPSPEAKPTTPAAPKPRQSQFGLTPEEYAAGYSTQPNVPQGTTSTAPDAGSLNINTDYTAQKGSYAPGRAGDGKIQGIILHSSDGREKGDINTLTTGGVSAHYYVTTDGRVYNLVNDGDTAYHAGKVVGPYNNSNTIGIEQEHYDPGGKGGKDGEAWSPAQVAATARLVASLKAKYGLTDNQIMGHSDVAPERKQDPYNYPWQGFFSAVDKQGGAAPAGAPGTAATAPAGTTAAVGGAQGYITGKATTFGYKDPDDPGVGAPKLGGLSTNNTDLIGIAVPEAALQAYVSAHPADWRKARVDVVGKNGQHVLVPIVDLGPRDTSGAVAADFTQGLTNLTGNTGDQNYQFKIIPNAGPDVMKNPQEFADEQAAIRAGINTGAKFQPKPAAKPSYVLAPISPAMSVAADTANQYAQQGQMDTLTQLADSTPNVVGLYKSLDKPVKGVSDAIRQQFQANLKPQIIGLMKQKYPDLSDDDAWAKAQADMPLGGALDVGADFWNKFVGSFQQLSPLLQQATGVQAEQSHVNAFLSQALPNGSDADKHALLTKLYAMPADQRGAYVSSLIPNPQTGVPGQDPQEIVSALDRLSDPNYAKQQAAQMDAAKAALKQRMATDPRLVGTPAAFASENLAQIPEMIAAAGIPPLMAAQIGQQLREQMKAEHPEYSEDELDQKAAYGTLVQLVGQEAAGRLFGAGTGALMQGIKSPVKRAIAQALTQTGLGAGISGGTQALTNVVTGEPIGQGVAAATAGGALQGGVTGTVHAGAEALHPEAPTSRAPLGEEPAVPPPVTGPKGGAVRGAEAETMATGGQQPVRPVTGAEEGEMLQPPTPLTSTSVLGSDVPDTSVPWYKPGPIVTRPGVERTTFTPEELTAATSTLPANATPQELAEAAARLRPPENFGRQTVALGEEGNVEAAQVRQMQAQGQTQAPRVQELPVRPQIVAPEQQAPSGLHPDNDIRVARNPLTGNPQVYLYGRGATRGALHFEEGDTMADAEALADQLRQRGTGGQYVDPGLLNKAFNRARERLGQSVSEARETAINAIFGPEKPAPTSTGTFRSGSAQDPVTQALRAKQPHIYATDPSGRENVAMIAGSTDGTYHVMMPQQGMHDPNKFYSTVDEAQRAARDAFQKAGWKISSSKVEASRKAVGESEPWVSKIANRFTVERMAAGDLGPVAPGIGVTKEEMIARGLKMPPETINQHVSNVMNDVGGNPRDQAAAIRAEEARLAQVSRDASLRSEANPGNQQLRTAADNAFKDVTDFHNGPVAKLKNNWHAQGMTLQGEIPVDLSTYNGLRDAYLRDVGKPPPANAEPVLRRTAKQVRDAAAAESEAVRKLGVEIERQSAKRPLPSDEQVRMNIIKRMKIEPCPT